MVNFLNVYDNLSLKQGLQLNNIDAEDIIHAIVKAGREEDYENTYIEFRLDNDRATNVFSIDYYEDPDTRNELAIIIFDNNTYEVPITDFQGDLVYSEVDKRLNQIKKEFGQDSIYIDSAFARAFEQNRVLENSEPESVVALEPDSVEMLSKNHVRTKLEETEFSVDIKDIALKLEEKGYRLRVKPGGHLLIQGPNLSPENSITITRKNSIIEDVNLQSPQAIALYQDMKDDVLEAVNDSFEGKREKINAERDSIKVAGVSILTATQDLVQTHINTADGMDLKDVFADAKASYKFSDEKDNDYLTLSLSYMVADDKDKTVIPAIEVLYGEEYGGARFTYEITPEILDSIKENHFFKTDLAKQINDLTAIGDSDRESQFANMKSWKVKSLLEKQISSKFSFLNQNKVDYFAKVAFEYYSDPQVVSLSEYQLDKLKEAPFYRPGMSADSIEKAMRDSFDEIESKINKLDLSPLKRNVIDYENFSYTKSENGEVVLDSKAKPEINYDREWINKLAKIEDSLLELRYGPVQDATDIAKSISRGTKEFLEGIAEFKKDGIYTGFDVGGGLTSFREGWSYGEMIVSLEKEYLKLANSESEMDRIAAIDKKMDLKLLRDDIRDNANVYTKAAISLRENSTKLLDVISSMKKEHADKTLSDTRFVDLKKQFVEYSKKFAESFNAMRASITKMNDNIKQFYEKAKMKALEGIGYTEMKVKNTLNNVKESFNEISTKAQIVLNVGEFNKDQIAENLNDIRVSQVFGSITCNDFINDAKSRFWAELDNSILAGETAKKTPEAERSFADNQAIRFGEQMKYQKNQSLFVASGIKDELEVCLKDNASYKETIERLAKVYNNESMTFRLRNSEMNTRNYTELSQTDKNLCRAVAKDLLHTMPQVEAAIIKNEITKAISKEFTAKRDIRDTVSTEKRRKNTRELNPTEHKEHKEAIKTYYDKKNQEIKDDFIEDLTTINLENFSNTFVQNFDYEKKLIDFLDSALVRGAYVIYNSQKPSIVDYLCKDICKERPEGLTDEEWDNKVTHDSEYILSLKAIEAAHQAQKEQLTVVDSVKYIAEAAFNAEREYNKTMGKDTSECNYNDLEFTEQSKYISLAKYTIMSYPEIAKDMIEVTLNESEREIAKPIFEMETVR